MQLQPSPPLEAQAATIYNQIEASNTTVLLKNLPNYFQVIFGSIYQPGWIHTVHHQLLHHKQDPEPFNHLQRILRLFGPNGKLSRLIFSGKCSGDATLESQQLPHSLHQIFNNYAQNRTQSLLKYETTLHKNKGVLDFRNKTLNLTMEEWFLFVLVESAVNSTFISQEMPPTADDFYHNMITNPYLILIRSHLLHFRNTNSINYQKLLFILKEYSNNDYIFSVRASARAYIVPKQMVVYIIYMLIYFDREGLGREDMLDFFKFYMSSKNRGIQAFESSSLSRLWLYYIRPFDHAESTIINLVLEIDEIEKFEERAKYLELKRFTPDSILAVPELNRQYYSMLTNYFELYIGSLNLSITSMFGRGQLNYKSIYMLINLSVLYSPNYQSSIGYIYRTEGINLLSLPQNSDYLAARDTLQRVKGNLQEIAGAEDGSLSEEKREMKRIYKEYKAPFDELCCLYGIATENEPTKEQKSDKASTVSSKSTSVCYKAPQMMEESEWDHEICSHELRVFYYFFLLIANLIDYVMENKRFSWRPTTNLRPLCSISVLLLVLITVLVFSLSLSYLL